MKIIKAKNGRVQAAMLTKAEFSDHENNYNGLCLACGKVAFGGTEPDAREYPCDYCEEEAVFGFSELLVEDRVKIS